MTDGFLALIYTVSWKPLLEVSALILGLANGLILLTNYWRDRPELIVRPIYPDAYQWFFMLPGGSYQGHPTRKYGFLTYISIANKGRRDVSLDSWRLWLKTVGHRWVELRAMSIPEPQTELGQSKNVKFWPVLGQKGVFHQGGTMVKAGAGIAGFAYYIAELYGDEEWNPVIKETKAIGKIVVRSIFGQKARTRVLFTEIPLEKARQMIEGIDQIDEKEN